jgi:hypothetical protein
VIVGVAEAAEVSKLYTAVGGVPVSIRE